MVHTNIYTGILPLLLLGITSVVLSHDDEQSVSMASVGVAEVSSYHSPKNFTNAPEQSYFAFPKYGALMLAHIGLMVLAWCFILPIGRRFSPTYGGFCR